VSQGGGGSPGGVGEGDGALEVGGGEVAGRGFGDDVAEGDVFVRVGELEEVVPVFLVEARERGEDEDAFFVGDGIGG
jgi:hypothetical protein